METTNDDGDDPAPSGALARQGVAHLQSAARELIAAARTVLDVAEEWVNDPTVAASLTSALESAGEVARRLATPGPPGAEQEGDNDSDDPASDRDGSRIERIPVT
jgi:hypothetical protein